MRMALSLSAGAVIGLLGLIATLQIATFAAVLNNARTSTSAESTAESAEEEASEAAEAAETAEELAEDAIDRVEDHIDVHHGGGVPA